MTSGSASGEKSPNRRCLADERCFWLSALTVVSFLVAFYSPVSYTASDPRGTLVTSQALVEHGTLKLDAYAGIGYVPRADSAGSTGSFRASRGHCYYYFPVGTPLVVTPFVWLTMLRGETMLDVETDDWLQNLLSALTVAAGTVLSYLLCRSFLSTATSLLLSTVLVFGGPLVSTMGTALWSANLATLCVLACLVVLGRGFVGHPYTGPALGGFLWAALVSRPTTAVAGIVILAYVFRYSLRTFVPTIITLVCLGGISLLLAREEYGTALPSYYRVGRAGESMIPAGLGVAVLLLVAWVALRHRASWFPGWARWAFPVGFACIAVTSAGIWVRSHRLLASATCASVGGVWASPSRGLLVYSPYLLLTIAGLVAWRKRMSREPMVWVACASLVLHTALVGRPTRWWGGHCFGGRLMTEAYPMAMLLTALVWREVAGLSSMVRRGVVGLMVVASILSVWINTFQGLYNPLTTTWNSSPDVDAYPDYAWNWRFPQFMSSPGLLAARELDHEARHAQVIAMRHLPPCGVGNPITPLSGTAYFQGWSTVAVDEGGPYVRQEADKARVFLWADPGASAEDALAMDVSVAADSGSVLIVGVNGKPVGLWRASDARRVTWRARLPAHLIISSRPTIVEFHLREPSPDASSGRARLYSLTFHSERLVEGTE